MTIKKVEEVNIPEDWRLTPRQIDSLKFFEDAEKDDFSDPYAARGLYKKDGVWKQVY